MPVSCHFRGCEALLVASLTHVSGAIASTGPLPFPLRCIYVIQHRVVRCVIMLAEWSRGSEGLGAGGVNGSESCEGTTTWWQRHLWSQLDWCSHWRSVSAVCYHRSVHIPPSLSVYHCPRVLLGLSPSRLHTPYIQYFSPSKQNIYRIVIIFVITQTYSALMCSQNRPSCGIKVKIT